MCMHTKRIDVSGINIVYDSDFNGPNLVQKWHRTGKKFVAAQVHQFHFLSH